MQSFRMAAVCCLICLVVAGCGPEGWSTGDPSTATSAATTTTTSGDTDISAADGPGVGETMYYSSFGTDDTSPIKLEEGEYTIAIDHFGTSAVSVAYYDMIDTSNYSVIIANHSGSLRATVDVTFVGSTYYFHVDANGDWTIHVTRNS